MMCMTPISVPVRSDMRNASKIRNVVPCGTCPICLSNRRQEWVIRLKEEFRKYYSAYFVTLTYADENCPINYDSDGVCVPSLRKDDLQKFIKRLRKSFKKPLRYYAVGEYGSKTYRPHYHLILFNCSGADNFVAHIVRCWTVDKRPIGHIAVYPCTDRTIGYICKYHVLKGSTPQGADRSFALMSKGIGSPYIERMSRYHKGNLDGAFYSDFEVKMNLPRYYKNKLYSRGELATIAEKSLLTDKGLNLMSQWLSKHPNSSYFKDIQQRYETLKSNYRNKSKFNEKL